MTAQEYLARLRDELTELERLLSPPNYQRFTSRRTQVRGRVAAIKGMVVGLGQLMETERRRG